MSPGHRKYSICRLPKSFMSADSRFHLYGTKPTKSGWCRLEQLVRTAYDRTVIHSWAWQTDSYSLGDHNYCTGYVLSEAKKWQKHFSLSYRYSLDSISSLSSNGCLQYEIFKHNLKTLQITFSIPGFVYRNRPNSFPLERRHSKFIQPKTTKPLTSWQYHIGLLHNVTIEIFCGRFSHTTQTSVCDIQAALVK